MNDGLTGLPNHRQLIADGASELFAVFVDVDGLVWLNDYEGFAAGGSALISIASTVRDAAAGAAGQAYRVGGDEFVIRAAELDQESAFALAAHIVAQVHEKQLPYQRTDIPSRKTVEVNAVVFRLDPTTLTEGFGEHGLGGALRERIEEAVYAEKQRQGSRAGVVTSA